MWRYQNGWSARCLTSLTLNTKQNLSLSLPSQHLLINNFRFFSWMLPHPSFWGAPDASCQAHRTLGDTVLWGRRSSGVGVQGVGRKRSAEGRPGSARVTAEAQAMTAHHVPPSSACHPFWTLHSLAKHTGHRVTTTSHDPILQIGDWGIHLKEKGQNCDVRSMLRRPGFKIPCQHAPIKRGNTAGFRRWPWMWSRQH